MRSTAVVFVSDVLDQNREFTIKNTNSEGNSYQAVCDIKAALQQLFPKVYYYNSPLQFAENANLHKNDIVLSTYYGPASVESKALVPSICETYGIKYIGGSSYTQMLCNDKYLGKMYLRNYGLKTASAVLLSNPNEEKELNSLEAIRYPAIVKPNYGGGSNGIVSGNVINNYHDCKQYCKQLFDYQHMPLIVEEYIPGFEVELILAGNKQGVAFSQEVGIEINSQDYFNNEIYGLESKKIHSISHNYLKTQHIPKNDLLKIYKLFMSFNKVDFMRVDCRINENGTYIIELSPDCFLGKSGGFYKGFEFQNFSYLDMFKLLFKCGLNE